MKKKELQMLEELKSNQYIIELIEIAKQLDKDNFRERKREEMIEIAAKTITCFLEVLNEKENVKGGYDWLRRDIIGIWIWKITETPKGEEVAKRVRRGALSKYRGQRYWSEDALKIYSETGKLDGLRHEHVFQKINLAQAIINDDNTLTNIKEHLQKARCCIVTEKDHDKLHNLSKAFKGWKRYVKQDINVWEIREEGIRIWSKETC